MAEGSARVKSLQEAVAVPTGGGEPTVAAHSACHARERSPQPAGSAPVGWERGWVGARMGWGELERGMQGHRPWTAWGKELWGHGRGGGKWPEREAVLTEEHRGLGWWETGLAQADVAFGRTEQEVQRSVWSPRTGRRSAAWRWSYQHYCLGNCFLSAIIMERKKGSVVQGSKLHTRCCAMRRETLLSAVFVSREKRPAANWVSICLKAKEKAQRLGVGCLQQPTGCDLQETTPAVLPATVAASAVPAARHLLCTQKLDKKSFWHQWPWWWDEDKMH